MMRADMFKVIVERPRRGVRHATAVKLSQGKDQDRLQIGLKRHVVERRRDWKGLNENLAPLIRFLCSRRGRRWDVVFSEICSELDTGSTVKMHVRQHLGEIVMLDIVRGRHGEWLHDGRVIDERRRWWPDLCVDPADGVLKDSAVFLRKAGIPLRDRTQWHRMLTPPVTADLHWIGETRLLLRRNGCWFAWELDRRPPLDDVALFACLCGGRWHDDPHWIVVCHHQLSKRELKDHGLVAAPFVDGGRHD